MNYPPRSAGAQEEKMNYVYGFATGAELPHSKTETILSNLGFSAEEQGNFPAGLRAGRAYRKAHYVRIMNSYASQPPKNAVMAIVYGGKPSVDRDGVTPIRVEVDMPDGHIYRCISHLEVATGRLPVVIKPRASKRAEITVYACTPAGR